MNIFRHRHFKYGISYRDLEEMLTERGVEVDHSTIYRFSSTLCS
jgi:IS6 family transposase